MRVVALPQQHSSAQTNTRATTVRVVALPQQQRRSAQTIARATAPAGWSERPTFTTLRRAFNYRCTRMDAGHRHGRPRLARVRRPVPLSCPDGHRPRQGCSRGRLRDRRDGPALRRGAECFFRALDGRRERRLTAARAAQRRGLCGNKTVSWVQIERHRADAGWRQPRVDGVESTRHRAAAVTGTTSGRCRGRPKFDFHTGRDAAGY